MDDVAHVGFIDAHAEGVRRHHDGAAVVKKIFLHSLSFLVGKPRVVTSCRDAFLTQGVVEFIYGFSGGRVDDARVAGMVSDVAFNEGCLLRFPAHGEEEIRPVKAADIDRRLSEL